MLRRLRIENLVLIREAELALAPGLNAITGETGAGKTILAQAIGLLLGARGDAAFVGQNPPAGAVITYYQRARHLFGPLKLEVLDGAGRGLAHRGRDLGRAPLGDDDAVGPHALDGATDRSQVLWILELVEDGPKLLVFYLFDWSST